jgi:hypothetical protein
MSHSPRKHSPRKHSPRGKHGKHREPDPEISAIRDLRTAVINEYPDKAEAAHAECKGMFSCTKKQGDERKKCFDKHTSGLEALRGGKKKKSGGRARSRSRSKSRSRSGSRKKSRSRK